MNRFLVALALFAATAVAEAGTSPVDYLISPLHRYDPAAPAGNVGASAVITAPAVLALDNRPELMFGRFSTSGPFDRDQAFYLRTRRLGFGTESVQFEGEEGMRRYTLTLATPYGGKTALGLTYTLHSSDDDELRDLTSFDASVAYRPTQSLSLIFAGRNLGRTELRGERIDRFYEVGFGTLGLRGRVGFYLHGRLAEGDSIDEGSFFAGAHLFVSRSLVLQGRIDDESEIVAGAEVRFSQFAVGFHYFTAGGGEEGGFSYFRIFALR